MANKIVLYKVDISPCCRSVYMVAHLIGLELDKRDLNLMAGEHMTPEYLKLNPQHTVPTIVDNGKPLWDSHAICTYLIDKYAKNDDLYPKDLYLRARCNQRLFFCASVLYTRLWNCSITYFRGGHEIDSKYIKAIYEAYDLLEAILGNDSYLVENKLTVADLIALPLITSLDYIYAPIDASKYPRIAKWLGRLKKLNFYEELNGKYVVIYKQVLDAVKEQNKNKGK